MSEAPDAELPAQRFARLLVSGVCGATLYERLFEEFADITRADVFFGVALAWTDREAALVACEVEIRALRQQLAQARRAA